MKNAFLPIILITTTSLAFFSCEKEQLTAEFSTLPPAGVVIEEDVLFQYDYQNNATGEYYGWLIDKTGALRSYELMDHSEAERLPGGEYCQVSGIKYLLSKAATTHLNIQEDELLSNYKLINRASNGSLSAAIEDETQDAVITYRAYTSELVMDNSDGCGPNSSSTHPSGASVGERVYSLVTLKTEGALNQENTLAEAGSIVEWMQGLQLMVNE